MIDWEPILDVTAAVLAARTAVLLAALAIDWLVGEPDILWRRVPHPVVLFGRAISFMDKRLNKRRGVTGKSRQVRGILAIVILVVLAAIIGWGLSFGGPVVACIVVAVLLAARSLDEHIRAVATAMGEGIAAARTAVAMIVGRDTKSMKKGDIARAAIETGAENLSDGVIAPALWFLVGGLPGLLAYKMVNTADSMIGYRNAKYRAFGCGAARIDDVMNLIPARLTALLICGSAMLNGRGTAALGSMMRDGRHHASPNAGWPEAAMAGAINVWLAGPRRYGNRIRQARRFNEGGGEADASAIRAALQVLIMAQLLFALLILPAVLL
ncbi:MAG: adenosylcobinamide-phosphate synthase CbiB [Alphaproteobacteria bacterium]|nr:adenosylcobinamide-phosphate synthase CbiB [Alphaproteobacteria bacterium]